MELDFLLYYGQADGTYVSPSWVGDDGTAKGGQGKGTEFSFTHPLYSSAFSGLVKKERTSSGAFNFFNPFTFQLWCAIVAFLFGVALLLILIWVVAPHDQAKEFMSPDEKAAHSRITAGDFRSLPSAVFHSTYHTVAGFLQADDFEWVSTPERILRVALLFMVLITTATYTANLVAFLTEPAYKVHGPKTMMELQSATVCTTFLADTPGAASPLRPYVSALVQPSDPFCFFFTECGQKFCAEKLQSGEVDIWIDDKNFLHRFIVKTEERGCERFEETPNIRLLDSYSTIVFLANWANWPLAASMSEALLYYEKQPLTMQRKVNSFFLDTTCEALAGESTGTVRIKVTDMRGLFYICGAMCGCALLYAAFLRLCLVWSKWAQPADDDTPKDNNTPPLLPMKRRSLDWPADDALGQERNGRGYMGNNQYGIESTNDIYNVSDEL
mmetsp:Transcript_37951/g.63825  ORF Transcript_37951/g.63825 Transcript_37951/m.63825 type:complete len:442 (+) Transcript_37951:1076-2401(+)|eukprot:CAMPEP_0198217660 /NCGR_PEP_ID=MMETSP1445-20131203/65080_1 /TAXON_ID=36898 /ORGANISM="Pyramimonas sp., Strain CCMP2087" /LENGTH=441 /DNA_ID=CAMNT_0043894417 /DNA_START=960 /DNA_END=2285 /DNA_ORIENTATION=+